MTDWEDRYGRLDDNELLALAQQKVDRMQFYIDQARRTKGSVIADWVDPSMDWAQIITLYHRKNFKP